MPTFKTTTLNTLNDFTVSIPKVFESWASKSDPDALYHKTCARYHKESQMPWNLWLQRDMQKAYHALDSYWPTKGTLDLANGAKTQLVDGKLYHQHGPQWYMTLQAAGRDAHFLSVAILAFDELQHPIVQHAVYRWSQWVDGKMLIADINGKFIIQDWT